MTGNDIYKRCLALLGYTPSEEEAASCKALLLRMPEILLQILADLKLTATTDLSEEISGTELQIDAVCCGCTMLLALSEGDSIKNKVFTEIYNARRAAALSEISCVKDTLPKCCDGGI